ncbi:MAG: hypothetical protein R2932_52345 [Caldilineaceae bacterium]
MFVGERCFEGTRTFSTQGIDKAILNLFRMYAQMGTQEITFTSSGTKDPMTYADHNGFGETPDISGFATLAGNKEVAVLIYNHHDDWEMADAQPIALTVDNLPFDSTTLRVTHHRIDQDHSNAYSEWVRQGKPMYPAPGQYAAIKARDGLELLAAPQQVTSTDGKVSLTFDLPVHGISLVRISPQ